MTYARILRNIHRVRRGFASRRRGGELAPDLGRDLRMRMRSHDVTQRVLLLRREVRRVALAEHEQALVPEYGERAGVVGVCEPDEVEDERVEHLVWQRVLLVQQHADEERRRPCSRSCA